LLLGRRILWPCPSLCDPYLHAADFPSRSDVSGSIFRSPVNRSGDTAMLDIIYLTLGLGGFGLMAVYARLCGRL